MSHDINQALSIIVVYSNAISFLFSSGELNTPVCGK